MAVDVGFLGDMGDSRHVPAEDLGLDSHHRDSQVRMGAEGVQPEKRTKLYVNFPLQSPEETIFSQLDFQ